MTTPTYDLLDSTTLSASASSVTFTSIDQSYRDLVLVHKTANTAGIRFNNDSGSNYNYLQMTGNGSSTVSYSEANQAQLYGGWFGNQGLQIWHIMDYSATDKHKSVLNRKNHTNNVLALAGRWANTSAINRVDIIGGFMVAGDTFALYGISA